MILYALLYASVRRLRPNTPPGRSERLLRPPVGLWRAP